MAQVIVAGALGVISITGGLFLRRLLRELAALRSQLSEHGRQITGIERQMRAQRAHVTLLRQLLADDGDTHQDGPLPQAAVVNGNSPESPPGGHDPVRRKRHLGLYIGGGVAVLAAFTGIFREAAGAHRSQVIGAVTGAAVTAATVTMVTVQPWTSHTDYKPPMAIPPVSAPPTTHTPPGNAPPQPPPTPPPTPSAPPPASTTPPPASPPPSPSPDDSSPGPMPSLTDGSFVPIGKTSPTGSAPADPPDISPSVPNDVRPPSDGGGTGTPPPPPPALQPSRPPPPAAQHPADPALCMDLAVPALLTTGVCVGK